MLLVRENSVHISNKFYSQSNNILDFIFLLPRFKTTSALSLQASYIAILCVSLTLLDGW